MKNLTTKNKLQIDLRTTNCSNGAMLLMGILLSGHAAVRWPVKLLLFLAIVSVTSGDRHVSVGPDRGYQNVLIKLSKELNEDDCPQFLQGIKALLDGSSRVLATGLGGQDPSVPTPPHFQSATVLIPASWRDPKKKCGIAARPPPPDMDTHHRPDIVVEKPGPLTGHRPRAARSSTGCGAPGDFVVVPHTVLLSQAEAEDRVNGKEETNGTAATANGLSADQLAARKFAHEWVKYRYGVYDEVGFAGDKLYPSYYFPGEERHDNRNDDGRPPPVPQPTVVHNGPDRLAGAWLKPSLTTENDGQMTFETCDPSVDDKCRFVVSRAPEDNANVTCSLGATSGVSVNLQARLEQYCGRQDVRGDVSPNQQAVLCGGRPAMDVILSHPDFDPRLHRPQQQQQQMDTSNMRIVPQHNVQIQIVHEPPTRYVLALETSETMTAKDHWRWITKAAQKFIRFDLPVNSQLAVVSFSANKVRVEHPLEGVTSDGVRARLADAIPPKYHLSKSAGSCLACVLEEIFDVVLKSGASSSRHTNVAGSHVILISSGGGLLVSGSPRQPAGPLTPSESANGLDNSRQLIEENKDYILQLVASNSAAKISTITIPPETSETSDLDATSLEFHDQLAQVTGGRSFRPLATRSSHALDFYYGLLSGFGQVLADDSITPTETPQLVHKAVYDSTSRHNNNIINATTSSSFNSRQDDDWKVRVSQGSFVIDPTLGRDTLFGVFVNDEEEFLIRSVRFTDWRGQVYGPYTRMSSTLDLVNLKTINYVGQEPPFGDPSLLGRPWNYNIEWIQTPDRKSIVVVTSKPRLKDNNQLVSVSVTSSRTQDGLVGVYCRVTMGTDSHQRPVINATVSMEVEVEDSNGTIRAILPATMTDSGDGVVDLMAGDGVYSAHLTSYPAPGRYQFTLRVEGVDKFTLAPPLGHIQPESQTASACCGQVSHLVASGGHSSRLMSTGQFSRIVLGPTIHIAAEEMPDQARIKPGKVTNLEINIVQNKKDQTASSAILDRQIPADSLTARSVPTLDPFAGHDETEEQGVAAISASWTSVGGDSGQTGSVASYIFVYSANISSLLLLDSDRFASILNPYRDGFDGNMTSGSDSLAVRLLARLDMGSQPAGRFNQQMLDLSRLLGTEWMHYDTMYYLAVVAKDADGNVGPLSNFAHFYVAQPVVPSGGAGLEDGQLQGDEYGNGQYGEEAGDGIPALNLLSSEKDWIMVGVICGILLVLIVISIVSISYFCCVAHRRKQRQGRSSDADVLDAKDAEKGKSVQFGGHSHNRSRKNSTVGSLSLDVEEGLEAPNRGGSAASSSSGACSGASSTSSGVGSDQTDGTDAGSYDSSGGGEVKHLSSTGTASRGLNNSMKLSSHLGAMSDHHHHHHLPAGGAHDEDLMMMPTVGGMMVDHDDSMSFDTGADYFGGSGSADRSNPASYSYPLNCVVGEDSFGNSLTHHAQFANSKAAIDLSADTANSNVGGSVSSTGSNGTRTTPVYWSASQLLSKLDNKQEERLAREMTGGDYMYQSGHSQLAQNEDMYVLQTAGESFQHASNGGQVGAADGHHQAFQNAHRGTNSQMRQRQYPIIPEEFCVTVSNLPTVAGVTGGSASAVPRQPSAAAYRGTGYPDAPADNGVNFISDPASSYAVMSSSLSQPQSAGGLLLAKATPSTTFEAEVAGERFGGSRHPSQRFQTNGKAAGGNGPPPPLYPKPKNITQV